MADPREYAPVGVYLMVHDGKGALDFYQRAFAAEVIETYPHEDRIGHATLSVNGGEIMLSDEFPEELTGVRSPQSLGGTTTSTYLTVDDAAAWLDRAVQAGAEVKMPLADQFWGARYGQLKDPYGHSWSIGGPVRSGDAATPT